MAETSQNGNQKTIHFGVFDADLRTQELRRQGTRVKLPRQSFHILQILLERPGELVTRDELRNALWPEDTFVDFDHGLNNAVKRIRSVLGDSADAPRYIETLPRMGYRFIGPINGNGNGVDSNGNSHNGATHLATTAVVMEASVVLPAAGTRKVSYKRVGALAASVLLLVGLAGWALRWRQHFHEQPALTMIPFTSYPGTELAPTFSPDGNQIAFAWNGNEKNNKFNLYVKEVGTETPVRVTQHPTTHLAPAWSPDGRFLAAMQLDTDTGDLRLLVLPPMGGSERQLLRMRAIKYMYEMALAWTPDSQWLVFSKGQAEFHAHIAMINVQTLEVRELPDPSPRCIATGLATFSPDGKSMASACLYTWGISGVFVQSFPSGTAREVRELRGEIAGLQWSSDGRSLVYALDGNLWRTGLHGGNPERLWFGQNAVMPAIARKGNRIAYVHRTYGADIWRIAIGKSADAPSRPFPSDLVQQNPQFSPDGTRIVFESTRSGNPEVWVCNVDGSNPLQLTSFGGALTGTPRWSPDGQNIVFDSRATGKPELYIVSSGGGKPRTLPTLPDGGSVPFWSHDGKWIYFSSDVNAQPQIFKIPASGGQTIQLTKQGGLVSKEAADGKIYYSSPRIWNELWTVDSDGKNERRVEGLPVFAWPAWDLGRNGIYYFDALRGETAVSFYDFATRQSRVAVKMPGPPQPYSGQISVSPDEKSLVYSQTTEDDADIMLVEGFQ
jgi:Tol biopolymer transport system component/DNA-binding winged helix-turn-helix (wHTH) protein